MVVLARIRSGAIGVGLPRCADDKYAIGVLHKAIDEVIDWMKHAPFDYSNAVADPTGTIDEGNVVGWRYHRELLDILHEIHAAKELQ